VYAKVFTSIFDSTINQQPPHVFKVWIALLAFAQDQDGIVDMTPRAIANRTELPIDQVENALEILGAPDPMSRCQDHEGRRIIAIPGRPYGWQIVTFAHYRELKRSADRRDYMRGYMRERREGDGKSGSVGKQPVNSGKEVLGRLADTASASASAYLLGRQAEEVFTERWAKYPNKDGKKEARRHFLATVKTDDDVARFDRALENYLLQLAADRKWGRKPKNGSTFFNNWQDEQWQQPPAAAKSAEPREEGLGGLVT
jgi:hypothetical protein